MTEPKTTTTTTELPPADSRLSEALVKNIIACGDCEDMPGEKKALCEVHERVAAREILDAWSSPAPTEPKPIVTMNLERGRVIRYGLLCGACRHFLHAGAACGAAGCACVSHQRLEPGSTTECNLEIAADDGMKALREFTDRVAFDDNEVERLFTFLRECVECELYPFQTVNNEIHGNRAWKFRSREVATEAMHLIMDARSKMAWGRAVNTQRAEETASTTAPAATEETASPMRALREFAGRVYSDEEETERLFKFLEHCVDSETQPSRTSTATVSCANRHWGFHTSEASDKAMDLILAARAKRASPPVANTATDDLETLAAAWHRVDTSLSVEQMRDWLKWLSVNATIGTAVYDRRKTRNPELWARTETWLRTIQEAAKPTTTKVNNPAPAPWSSDRLMAYCANHPTGCRCDMCRELKARLERVEETAPLPDVGCTGCGHEAHPAGQCSENACHCRRDERSDNEEALIEQREPELSGSQPSNTCVHPDCSTAIPPNDVLCRKHFEAAARPTTGKWNDDGTWSCPTPHGTSHGTFRYNASVLYCPTCEVQRPVDTLNTLSETMSRTSLMQRPVKECREILRAWLYRPVTTSINSWQCSPRIYLWLELASRIPAIPDTIDTLAPVLLEQSGNEYRDLAEFRDILKRWAECWAESNPKENWVDKSIDTWPCAPRIRAWLSHLKTQQAAVADAARAAVASIDPALISQQDRLVGRDAERARTLQILESRKRGKVASFTQTITRASVPRQPAFDGLGDECDRLFRALPTDVRNRIDGMGLHPGSIAKTVVDEAIKETDRLKTLVDSQGTRIEHLHAERDEAVAAFKDATRLRSEIQQARIKAEKERDELQGWLESLLAMIHRDGGHHTAKVGREQSVIDATAVWSALRLDHNKFERETSRIESGWNEAREHIAKIEDEFSRERSLKDTRIKELEAQLATGLAAGVDTSAASRVEKLEAARRSTEEGLRAAVQREEKRANGNWQRIKELESQIDRARDACVTLEQARNTYRANADTFARERDGLATELSSAKVEIERKHQLETNYFLRMEKAEGERDALRTERNAVDAQLEQLLKEREELSTLVGHQRAEIDRLKNNCAELRTQVAVLDTAQAFTRPAPYWIDAYTWRCKCIGHPNPRLDTSLNTGTGECNVCHTACPPKAPTPTTTVKLEPGTRVRISESSDVRFRGSFGVVDHIAPETDGTEVFVRLERDVANSRCFAAKDLIVADTRESIIEHMMSAENGRWGGTRSELRGELAAGALSIWLKGEGLRAVHAWKAAPRIIAYLTGHGITVPEAWTKPDTRESIIEHMRVNSACTAEYCAEVLNGWVRGTVSLSMVDAWQSAPRIRAYLTEQGLNVPGPAKVTT